jgi:hypothetical protein
MDEHDDAAHGQKSFSDRMLAGVPARWRLAIQVLPIVAVLIAAKFIFHSTGADFIELTTLLGSVVAATVFLLGFLLAGTLTDYKESERLPGELAGSMEAIADECLITYQNKGEPAEHAVLYVADFVSAVHRWFYRAERTTAVMERLSRMNDIFLRFESLTQPNFIVRMKQEQSAVRKVIMRIDTIRDTSFVSAGYTIAEIATAMLFIGLLFAKFGALHEALFYIAALGFFMSYLMALIRDLDNPFGFTRGAGSAEVSIKPIADLDEKLSARVAALRARPATPGEAAV